MIPPGAVLLLEGHEHAVGIHSRRPARVVEQHQREQAFGLRFVVDQLDDESAESDRLVAQRDPHHVTPRARGVALVEQEVHDREHATDTLGPASRIGNAERDPRVADLALGPHQPLRHRRLGDEERTRDLGGGEPGEGAQGQRHARVERERGMAAREDQPQAVVGDASELSWYRLVRTHRVGLQELRGADFAPSEADRPRLRAVVVSHAPGLEGTPSLPHRSSAFANAS